MPASNKTARNSMPEPELHHVFLSYNEDNQDTVEALARRLQGDARLSFWFGPWHSVPGMSIQEQMEEGLRQAQACAVFISGVGEIVGWQNEQMRVAIQSRVEDDNRHRIIPVLLPGATRPRKQDLPRFLRRYEPVEFHSLDDDYAFKRLLAGILGIPPIQVENYIQAATDKAQLSQPPSGRFEHGHALVIGIADYPKVKSLPKIVLDDARALREVLVSDACGYLEGNVTELLNSEATYAGIHMALADLAARTNPDDTVIVFFSGHGAHNPSSDTRQYILPFDFDPSDVPGTAIAGDEMTALLRSITADRLLVLFDSCHSGGAADPKELTPEVKTGLSEDYYAALAHGTGRVVIASSRADEVSWALGGMNNSLFTHYLLEAFRGAGRTLGDGYVRVFDVFRHVADHVPTQARQHPIFKATAMENDFPIALTAKEP